MSIQKSRAGPEFSVLTLEHHLALEISAFFWDTLPFSLFLVIAVNATAGISPYTVFDNFLDDFFVLLFLYLVAFLTSVFPEVSMYVTRRSQLLSLESEMARVETHVGTGSC